MDATTKSFRKAQLDKLVYKSFGITIVLSDGYNSTTMSITESEFNRIKGILTQIKPITEASKAKLEGRY